MYDVIIVDKKTGEITKTVWCRDLEHAQRVVANLRPNLGCRYETQVIRQ